MLAFENLCRICRDAEELNNGKLISPCHCKGMYQRILFTKIYCIHYMIIDLQF